MATKQAPKATRAPATPPDPEDIYQRLRRLFIEDGCNPETVTRSAPIFDNTGLGYARPRFADGMEGPINREFDCHTPIFRHGQLSDTATVGDCRDQIIKDNGK